MESPSLDRYSRQIKFAGIGPAGQQKLRESKVLLCGCGALGSILADTLVRAGVGTLRIVDRDFVDLTNLQRQVLYDEEDVAAHLPKAIVAANKLGRVNSQVILEPHVADVNCRNIREYVDGVDLILDGTDNFETRFLINDISLETRIPWIFGGVIGSHGQAMTVFPYQSACLRCVIESPPEPGMADTCDTAGVIAPAVHMVTSLQSTMALKILSGQASLVEPQLSIVDVWSCSFRQMSIQGLREQGDCPACGSQGRRDWLNGTHAFQSTVLCGRNSVQIAPSEKVKLSLEELADRMMTLGNVMRNPFLLRFTPTGLELQVTVFRDGRAIVQGTEDVTIARSIYARFIGG
jgi:adenylyltransferase/sulfurtransferase